MADMPDESLPADGILRPIHRLPHHVRAILREHRPEEYARFKKLRSLPEQVQMAGLLAPTGKLGFEEEIGERAWGELYFNELTSVFEDRLEGAVETLGREGDKKKVEWVFDQTSKRLVAEMPEGIIRQEWLKLLDKYERKVRSGSRQHDQSSRQVASQTEQGLAARIGQAIIDYRELNDGEYPLSNNEAGKPFHGSKMTFYDWAGEQIGGSGQKARRVLERAGCLPVSQQGSSDELEEALERTIRYAKDFQSSG